MTAWKGGKVEGWKGGKVGRWKGRAGEEYPSILSDTRF